ncbi:DUF551 domain-containing protein [Salmonella enterica]|nr:DUF551 domain-containing protein [Salmonella enterica subsp. diarizonae serovar 53:z10:z]EIF8218070.1 DUF551 domain-containing protein [Salmonella enterica]ELI6261768.1 DUF551 domain-containing protein [Salmonella enterica]ELI6401196.1 DUF551 domain-containing protein [Salmonella enterica]
MTTITKEWLQQTIAEFENTRDDIPFGLSDDDAKILIVLKRALASLDAKPIYQYQSGIYNDDNGETDWYWDDCDAGFYKQYAADRRRIVYTAQPAPVVPDEWTIQDAVKFCRETGRQDAGSAMEAWNACRTAMLNGDIFRENSILSTNNFREIAETSTNSPVTPDGWIICSERMPDREYVLAGDFSGTHYLASIPNVQVGIYADWFDDEKPCWDDGDGNDLHLKEVTHWMPLPAAPQQEVK